MKGKDEQHGRAYSDHQRSPARSKASRNTHGQQIRPGRPHDALGSLEAQTLVQKRSANGRCGLWKEVDVLLQERPVGTFEN